MNYKIIIIGISIFCFLGKSYSQETIRTDYYFNNLNYFNTAAGLKDTNYNHQIQLYGNYKFISSPTFKPSPVMMLSYLGMFGNRNSFVNAHYIYDNYSFYTRHQALLGYAYNLIFKGFHSLRIGIRANLSFIDIQKDLINHIPANEIKDFYFLPDLDFALQYHWKGLNIGLSGKNLLGNNIKVENEVFLRNLRGFYMNLSYDFVVKENYTLSPYTLLRYEQNFLVDLGLMVNFYKYVEVGVHMNILELRNTYLISGMIIDRFRIGASVNHSFIHPDINLNVIFSYRL